MAHWLVSRIRFFGIRWRNLPRYVAEEHLVFHHGTPYSLLLVVKSFNVSFQIRSMISFINSFAFPQRTRRLIFTFKVLEIFFKLFEISTHHYNQIQVLFMLFFIKQSAVFKK